MSDNLPPEVVQEELEARLRISTEVWTDVFKLLPRRVLVQKVAPTCYRFKEVSDKNVKNIHVITQADHADQFTDKLNKDDPEANQQLGKLAGHNCQLASQFRLINLWISEKSKVILQHCPDLFKGCQITLGIKEENKESTIFSESLGHLEGAKPAEIRVIQGVDQFGDFWHHPTFLKCNRVLLEFCSHLADATMKTAFVNIFDWLHHKPIGGMDCDASAAGQDRCMIVWLDSTHQNHIDLLLNRCSEDIQQAQQPIDRRSYVFSFNCWDWDWSNLGQFRRIENKSTGEVLTLERKMLVNGGQAYRFRRCLAEEEANGAVFYAGMFEQDSAIETFHFGNEKPRVTIS